jgi:hypothetical protein
MRDVSVEGPRFAPERGGRFPAGALTVCRAPLQSAAARAGVAGKRISPAGEGSNLSQEDSASASLVGVRAELQVSPMVVGAGN